MAQPRKVKPRDRLKADDWNALVDAVTNRLMGLGGLLGGQMGVLGTPQAIPRAQIALVEAYERAEKSNDNEEDEFGNGGQVWSMLCRFVAITSGQTGYHADEDDDLIRVYFPTQYRKTEGAGEQGTVDYPPVWHQTSDNVVLAGGRFWAIVNPASGRWEYLGPPNQIVRFKLTEALTAGGSALATVMWSQAGTDAPSAGAVIRVYDWQGGASASATDLGYAIWFPDLGRWETVFIQASTLQLRPIELVKTSDQTVTVDTKTYLKFQNLKNLNTDWYDAGDEDGGSPLEATNITLKLQGWYELGYSVQWDGPITSGGGTGTSMSFGTCYLEIDDPAGAGKTLLTGSGQQHAVLHDDEDGASLGGNMARQILYRNDTTRAVFVRLATENGSATHNRTFGASVMWAQYLGHDLDPDTTIDDLS